MMKRLLLVILLASNCWADNVSVPSKPFTFSPGTTIFSSQVNSDLDTIYTALANIGLANILAGGVGTSQLASGAVTSAKLDSSTVAAFLTQTGMVADYVGTSAPTGWVLADGNTIGSAASAASERANADTANLYTLIYNSMSNAQAPVSTGRGVSAAADFAANKTIVLPDLRGRVVAGVDNMGGSAASRITAAGLTFDGTVNGLAGGTQNTTLSVAQLAAHTHTDSGHTHTFFQSANANFAAQSGGIPVNAGGSTVATGSGTANISTTGSGSPHAILQPTIVLYKIIKL